MYAAEIRILSVYTSIMSVAIAVPISKLRSTRYKASEAIKLIIFARSRPRIIRLSFSDASVHLIDQPSHHV